MKKLICALIGTAALVASATTYIQTSTTGTAPWRPVKDSVSLAHLADSALHAPPSAYADSARVSGLADSAKKAGAASNALALGGFAASSYGTLSQDTAIAKKVASDTANVLRSGIASAVTTSEAYATARISDSLTANARAWITLAVLRGGIHDSLTVERAFDSLVARNVTHDSATAMRSYVGGASTTGNAATATKLAAARTIGMSGDVVGTATAFDGTANITIPTTLPTLLTAGSAGSATSVPTLTWDKNGRLTAVGSATISIPHSQISDWTSTLAGYQPLNSNLTQLSGGTNGLVIASNVGATNYFSDVAAGDAILRLGAPYTETVRLGVMSSSSGSNASSLWFNANSAGSNYTFSAPSFVENGTALSSKYLGINASIPSSRISDWSTYINQPLLTTSSPTFAGSTISSLVLAGTESDNITNVQLANSVITTNPPVPLASQRQGLKFNWYDNNYTIGVIRGSATDDQGFGITYNGGTNLRWRCTNGTTYDYNSLTVSGLITANGGIAGNLTGTASNASALGGVAASSYLLASTAAKTYLPLSGGTLTGALTLSNSNLYISGGRLYSDVDGTGTSSFWNINIGSSLTVNAVSTFNKGATFYNGITAQHISAWGITPSNTGVYDLGSSSLYWNNVYANNMYAYGQITASGRITANSYSVAALNDAPASASSTGTVGQIRWTDGYVYLCIATNTWKRAALTTW